MGRSRLSRYKWWLLCFGLVYLYGLWRLFSWATYLDTQPAFTGAVRSSRVNSVAVLPPFGTEEQPSPVFRPVIQYPQLLNLYKNDGMANLSLPENTKICLLTLEFAGLGQSGGIGTAVWSLTHLFAEGGAAVTVLHSPWGSLTKEEKMKTRTETAALNKKGIKLVVITREKGSEDCNELCITSLRMFRWLSSHPDSCKDLIYYHDNMAVAYWALIARSQGIVCTRMFDQLTLISQERTFAIPLWCWDYTAHMFGRELPMM